MNKIRNYRGWYMRDDRPKFRTGSFLFNLMPNGRGSHWVALFIKNDRADYLDPYAVNPPQNIKRFIKDNATAIYYNGTQLQKKGTVTCGYFCTIFLWWMYNGGTHYDFIHNYFSSDRDNNEKMIKEIVDNI